MTLFGITMDVAGVKPVGIQIIEHRMDRKIDPSLSNEQIRHLLVKVPYRDECFTKDLTLESILTDCINQKVIPVININACWWYQHSTTAMINPAQYARICRICADYMLERGFRKGTAYVSCFNEPGKWLTTKQTCDYTNAVADTIGDDFDVVCGNDEMNMLNWDYLGANCRAKVMAVHHLSSVGWWGAPYKFFKNIENFATTCALHGKIPLGSECGSWFTDYCSDIGHRVNLDIMRECKKYNYLGCLIVLADCNQGCRDSWRYLGYQVWNDSFTAVKAGSCTNKYNEFIEFIKKEGEVMTEYLRPNELQALYEAFGLTTPYRWETPNLYTVGAKDPSKTVTWADIDAMTETQLKGLVSGLKKIGVLPSDFPDYPNIKYKAEGSWNSNWQDFAKSGGPA